jgi:hypothetical protein
MSRLKSWPALAAALTVALATSLAGPTDARADRCNPDEMIAPVYTLATGQPYEPVFGEDDGPFCYAMKNAVYPAIGCDPAWQSLADCVNSQPDRVATLLAGLCAETGSEVYDAYLSLPYRVRQLIAEPSATLAFGCRTLGPR